MRIAMAGAVSVHRHRPANRRSIPRDPAHSGPNEGGDDIAPIPGTKRVSRLKENAAADALELTAGQLASLDAIPPPVGDRYADMTRIDR
jgi:hypothetical protein